MALCSDQSITFLNGAGYNVVRVPRTGIGPLDVITSDGWNCERLGRLDQLWTSTRAVPATGPARAAADIDGQRTGDLKLSIGLKFLAATLGAMGARIPDVSFAYARAQSVRFQFANVRSTTIDPLLVGEFLQDGDLHAGNPFVERYFLDQDSEAFVLTEVLESDQLLVVATTDRSTEISVDLPAIQQSVGASVAVSARTGSQTQVTYRGPEFLSFAFKAFSIVFRDGRWQVEGVASKIGLNIAGGLAALAPGVIRQGTILLR